jgi:hypothetical protein
MQSTVDVEWEFTELLLRKNRKKKELEPLRKVDMTKLYQIGLKLETQWKM